MCSQALPAIGSTMKPRKLRLRPQLLLTCSAHSTAQQPQHLGHPPFYVSHALLLFPRIRQGDELISSMCTQQQDILS